MITYKQLNNDIEKELLQMIRRGNNLRALLGRSIYRIYQNAQRNRWMTENESEGDKWQPLNPKYAEKKKIKFAQYPGSGSKMMIATNRLVESVIGPSADHRKIVEQRRMIISTVVPYAKYANEKRPFDKFGDKTTKKIIKSIEKYVMKNKIED